MFLFQKYSYLDKMEKENVSLPIVITIHSVIISIGIVANSIVVLMFICNEKLRNVRNAFMVKILIYRDPLQRKAAVKAYSLGFV